MHSTRVFPSLCSAAVVLCAAAVLHAQQPIAVPTESVKNLTYITCSIADSGPLHCLVDTGSSMTGIASSTAKRLGLRTHVDSSIARVDVASQALDEVTLHAGSASWKARRVSIAPADLDLLDRESGEGFHTDVVIGTSLLEAFQVTLDPDAHEVRLAPSGTAVPQRAQKLPSSYILQVPFTILQIKSRTGPAGAGPFTLDLGSRPAIMLSHSFWETRPPLATHDPHGTENQQFTLNSMLLGVSEMKDVPAYEPLHEGGVVASKNVGGVIGAPVLNRFIVTFDLQANGIRIIPGSSLPASL